MSAAGELLNRARRHVKSAEALAEDDPTLALTASHDAATQALSAHLRAAGYRVKAVPGAHRLIIDYAAIALRHRVADSDLSAVDHLRRDRHTAEYGDYATSKIGPQQAKDAAALAARVLRAVSADLAEQTKPPKPG